MKTKPWGIPELSQFCLTRQEHDLDLTIALTGAKGLGKSTLAAELAMEAMKDDFSMSKCILLTPDAMKIAEHIDASARRPVIVLDESIGSLYTENWANSAQKSLHIYLNQFQRRGKNAVLVLCIPSIFDLRGVLVRSSVDLWIHVLGRGEAVVMLRSPAPVQDPFFRDSLFEIWESVARSTSHRNALSQYEVDFQRSVYGRMPTFLAYLNFPELEPKLYKEYLDHVEGQREEIRKSIFEAAEDEKLKSKRRKQMFDREERRGDE